MHGIQYVYGIPSPWSTLFVRSALYLGYGGPIWVFAQLIG